MLTNRWYIRVQIKNGFYLLQAICIPINNTNNINININVKSIPEFAKSNLNLCQSCDYCRINNYYCDLTALTQSYAILCDIL